MMKTILSKLQYFFQDLKKYFDSCQGDVDTAVVKVYIEIMLFYESSLIWG